MVTGGPGAFIEQAVSSAQQKGGEVCLRRQKKFKSHILRIPPEGLMTGQKVLEDRNI